MSNIIEVPGGSVGYSDTGAGDPLVLLHGWPQDHTAWSSVIALAGATHRCIALDLPGIGTSRLDVPHGSKAYLADVVHAVVKLLELPEVTLVGHDIGGMVAYAYLRRYPVRGAVLVDTIVPGVPPWEAVAPRLWHFGFHRVPGLPEAVVGPSADKYFNYFFDAVARRPSALTSEARRHYIDSYGSAEALRQGFEFYRSFETDAADNAVFETSTTPVLYARGVGGTYPNETYADGLRETGLTDVTVATIEDSGHYAPSEQPELLWTAIRRWLDLLG